MGKINFNSSEESRKYLSRFIKLLVQLLLMQKKKKTWWLAWDGRSEYFFFWKHIWIIHYEQKNHLVGWCTNSFEQFLLHHGSTKHLLNKETLSWWEICFQEKVNEKPIMYNIWLLTKRWTRTITVANIILEVTTTYNTAWLLIKCKSAKFGQEHLSPPCIFAYYILLLKTIKEYSRLD